MKDLFTGMPRLKASIIIVQHMPEFINLHFTQSLDKVSELNFRLAQDGDRLEEGTAYIAPSGIHLGLISNKVIRLKGSEKINYVCPAVDITMQSVCASRNMKITGIILTGMGKDGAQGMIHIKSLGGTTIVQDKKTSIIYGMPQEAAKTGLIDFILPVNEIAQKMIEICCS
ncbi:chemotaxis protein CheB [bacterium]|nr:chemotaxis protein CheB [bacterium]